MKIKMKTIKDKLEFEFNKLDELQKDKNKIEKKINNHLSNIKGLSRKLKEEIL